MKSKLAKTENAYIAIFLLGMVSLMGDVVYEGSRGIVPSYLNFLGASVFIIAFVGRFGEFIGYAFRLISGVLSDTTQAYWTFIILGYGLILSLPLLGFTNGWEIAIILVLLERLGKAIRSPSRDAVLSIVSKGVGTGKAFGLHELLDQIGAVLGPLLVSGLMFYSYNNYKETFGLLFLPFAVLLVILFYAYGKIGKVERAEPEKGPEYKETLRKTFYIYTLAITLNTVGLIPYELILYKASINLQPAEQWIVPLFYTAIQLADAPSALFSGYVYDKLRTKVLILPFTLSVIPPLIVMADAGLAALMIASIVFGLVLGMQESIYRAAVSEFAPVSLRGTAYGIFNTAYGLGMLASGATYGLLATLRPPFTVVLLYVSLTQFFALVLLANIYVKE